MRELTRQVVGCDHESLKNMVSRYVCSGVGMIYRDGSVVTPFLCDQGASREMRTCMEESGQVWEAVEGSR